MPNKQLSCPLVKFRGAVLVLAAGHSQRLGQPKQLLNKNGKSLLAYVINMAESIKPERTVVVINNNLEKFSQTLNLPSVEFIVNPISHTGMASSLQTGVKQLKDYQYPVLILAIDQPCLTFEHLQQLVNTLQKHKVCHVASTYANTIGIPVIVQPELLLHIGQLSRDQGLKSLLLKQSNILIKVSIPELAFDIDMPFDLAMARDNQWIDSY